MNRQDFHFDLPEALIAQYPLPNRTDSRLLIYDRQTGVMGHHQFSSLADFLQAGDVLVFNNSKVIPARFYGHKLTGGRVEFLVERVTGEHTFLAHIKSSKSPKPGTRILLDKGYLVEVTSREDDLFCCVSETAVDELLHDIGHIPLPPYITRHDETLDHGRYQTVYAEHKGSVAAPTAGLHFDDRLLEQLKQQGVHIAFSTLHVGAGTFQPVRVDNILEHKMHSEWLTVDESLCEIVNQAIAEKRRVIAVGTTAMRSLESAAKQGRLVPFQGLTDIFIYPGYTFQICSGLITNFHLPESTLLMLVSAFIGYDETMQLYQTAIQSGYRFFSYGDTSLLL